MAALQALPIAAAQRQSAAAGFAELAARLAVPGAGAAIARAGGDTMFAAGKASIGFDIAVSADTLFHVGSNGKHITAVAILRLIDRGQLALDTKIGDILTDIPPTWRSRSVAGLLSHTAGLPEYSSFDWSATYDHKAFLALFASTAPIFDEGAAWAYSNTNYVMLGWVIEAISQKPFRRVIEDDVLGPLHLPHARVDAAMSMITGRAEPYNLRGKVLQHAVRMSNDISGWPDGGVLMSARDWPGWNRALDSDALLSPALRKTMVSPTRLTSGRSIPYGFGLFVDPLRGAARQWHGGSVPGFTSYMVRSGGGGPSLLVMTNGSFSTSAIVRYLGNSLLESVVPGSSVLSLPVLRDGNSGLTREALAILSRGASAPDASRFTSELTVLLGQPGGRDAVLSFPDDRKPLTFELVEEIPQGRQLLRRYRATYPDRTDHMLFGYDADERIFWTFFN